MVAPIDNSRQEAAVQLTVVIRTYNSGQTLKKVFTNLHRKQGDQVLIVDSGSNDSTIVDAAGFGAQIIHLAPFIYSRALNAGFEAADNEWVIALSSHCIPIQPSFMNDWRSILASCEQDIAVVFGSRFLSPKDIQGAAELATFGPEVLAGHKPAPVWGGSSNGAYRRSVWELHRFQEGLPTAEDGEWAEWSLLHGYRIAFASSVPVLYAHQGSFRYMFHKGFVEAQTGRKGRQTLLISLRALGVNLASLGWKWCRGSIRLGTFLRQVAHGVGAFLGTFLPGGHPPSPHDPP